MICQRQVHANHLIVDFVVGLLVGITNAEVQRQLRQYLPIVLRINRIAPLPHAERASDSGNVCARRFVEKKVGEAIVPRPGVGATIAELPEKATLVTRGKEILLVADKVCTELENL